MEKQKLIQYLGVAIAIIMALSMIAVGFIYNEDSSTGNDPSVVPTTPGKSFDYTVSFEGQVLKELNSIKIASKTNVVDKASLDLAVSKVAGVSKVSSQFQKASDSDKNWFYLAEISLKRDSNILAIVENIFALDSFIPGSNEGMKYVTVSPPPIVEIYNADLNITRDFNFPSNTLPALVYLETKPSDKIMVDGTIKLQGTTVLSLELIESYPLTEQLIDLNLPTQ